MKWEEFGFGERNVYFLGLGSCCEKVGIDADEFPKRLDLS